MVLNQGIHVLCSFAWAEPGTGSSQRFIFGIGSIQVGTRTDENFKEQRFNSFQRRARGPRPRVPTLFYSVDYFLHKTLLLLFGIFARSNVPTVRYAVAKVLNVSGLFNEILRSD